MRKGRQSKWQISTESVYAFGREERLQSVYEIILPTEKILLKGDKENDEFEVSKDRFVCTSIK